MNYAHYVSQEIRGSNLVQHVVNHGTYHREQIIAMLRKQGHEGTPADFL